MLASQDWDFDAAIEQEARALDHGPPLEFGLLPDDEEADAAPQTPRGNAVLGGVSDTPEPTQPPLLPTQDEFITPPKRRRLFRKTTDIHALWAPAPAREAGVCEPTAAVERGVLPASQPPPPDAEKLVEEFPSPGKWYAMSDKSRYYYVYNLVRKFWASRLYVPQEADMHDLGPRRALALRDLFAKLSSEEKEVAMSAWLAAVDAPEYVSESVQHIFARKGRPSGGAKMGFTCLLTYIGPWKLCNDDGSVRNCEGLSLTDAEHLVRSSNAWEKKWKYFLKCADCIRARLHATDLAACMEICPRSLEEENYVRLHFHLFLRANQHMRQPPCGRVLAFEDSSPHLAGVVGGLPLAKARNNWAGYFYCVVKKFGSVYQHGSRRPFKDFLVSAQWVVALLQAKKISAKYAKELILQTCHNVTRYLKEMEVLESLERQTLVERALAEAHAHLSTVRKRFKTIAAVETWRAQYRSHDFRFKFLVLDGPSRMGKTQFAHSLVEPPAHVYEINCASGSEPDLRGYRFDRDALILFDEIEAPAVASQRKLFQAAPTMVQLGCSSTNCHSYSVCVYRVMMVLCSNNWRSSLRQLNDADMEWVSANSVVVDVLEPLWVNESN